MSLEQVTIDASGTSWVDSVPGAQLSTSYQAQNTSSEAARVGVDKTCVEVSGDTATVKISGPVDDNGLIFSVTSDIVVSSGFEKGKNYLFLDTAGDNTERLISVTQDTPIWNASKNAYYTADNKRVLNTGIEKTGDSAAVSLGTFKLNKKLGTPIYFKFGYYSGENAFFVSPETIYEGMILKDTTGEWLIEIPAIEVIPADETLNEQMVLWIVNSDGTFSPGDSEAETVFGDQSSSQYPFRCPRINVNGKISSSSQTNGFLLNGNIVRIGIDDNYVSALDVYHWRRVTGTDKFEKEIWYYDNGFATKGDWWLRTFYRF